MHVKTSRFKYQNLAFVYCFLFSILAANSVHADELTTIFASNNGFAGNSFDIEVVGSKVVTITGWQVNIENNNPANQTIAVYWREGSVDGFQDNPDGWTLMGKDTAVVPAGLDLPSAVNVGGLTMSPGQTYGIYIDFESFDGSSLMRYTNGGPESYSDANISLTTFRGQASPAFSGSFTYRIWNGTVIYDTHSTVPVPVLDNWKPVALLVLMIGLLGVAHTRIKSRVND